MDAKKGDLGIRIYRSKFTANDISAVPMTDTTLEATTMRQARYLGIKRYYTPEASSKVCKLEKDRGATSLTGQGVKNRTEIADKIQYRPVPN